MALDFEALVGHLYVVGGRAINTTPPGSLVEVAPRKVARGRELDTIFVLVTPSGEVTAPAAFYDQMATLAAERYFNSSGSVTAGLRTVFTSLNQDLFDHNNAGKRPYEANILCAVLRDDELFLGRVGASLALIYDPVQNAPQPFPTDFSNEETLFGPPLGIHPMPDIKMSKYTVYQGSRLILGDARLADLEMPKITESIGGSDISEVLGQLKEAVTTQITLLVAEFVPPEAPSPVPVKEGRSTSKAATPAPSSAPTPEAVPEAAGAQPPEAPSRRNGSQVQRSAGKAAIGLARAFDGINYVLDRIFPRPAEGKRPWMKASTMAGITVLIPVVMVALVMVMGLGGVQSSEFDLCVDEATRSADVARSVISSDVNGTVNAWTAVLAVVRRCSDIRQDDPTLIALTREGQTVIDKLSQVERRETTALSSFPNAVLNQVVLQGTNIYVLDAQNQQVYQITLTEDGRQMLPDSRRPIPDMRINATVSGFRLGNLIDIAWAESITQIVALDENGVLIQCSPRFLQSCQAQQLIGAERWGGPLRITIWQDRLYILDPPGNQIWRYASSGGTYAEIGSEYFVGSQRPDIRNAVDFAIDDRGSVYILTASGEVTKWVSGEQNPFVLGSFPEGQQIIGADAMFLDTNPITQAMYIASRASATIYEMSLAGTFINSYRSFNEDHFAALTNVVADANQGVIYALSGNSIFVFDKQASPTS